MVVERWKKKYSGEGIKERNIAKKLQVTLNLTLCHKYNQQPLPRHIRVHFSFPQNLKVLVKATETFLMLLSQILLYVFP